MIKMIREILEDFLITNYSDFANSCFGYRFSNALWVGNDCLIDIFRLVKDLLAPNWITTQNQKMIKKIPFYSLFWHWDIKFRKSNQYLTLWYNFWHQNFKLSGENEEGTKSSKAVMIFLILNYSGLWLIISRDILKLQCSEKRSGKTYLTPFRLFLPQLGILQAGFSILT